MTDTEVLETKKINTSSTSHFLISMEIAERALDLALRLGATYADVRVEELSREEILIRNGLVESACFEVVRGAGIRVLANTWGFASTTSLTKQAVERAVKFAVKMAKAAKVRKAIELAPQEPEIAKTKTSLEKDPFKVAMDEKVELCLEADRRARVDESIKRTSVSMEAERSQKLFLSTEGTQVESIQVRTYADIFALAKKRGVTEYYDDICGGSGGFEIIKRFDLVARAKEVGEKAVKLASARPMPRRSLPVVLDPDFVSLLVHEIIGHPSEADRVLGKEAAWAGRAWWAGKIGQKVGSSLVTVVDDPQVEGALGYFDYDDEGVPAKRKYLIQEGILREHMHSRETAAEFEVEPNGCMRAQSFRFAPLIRMSNTFVEPGDYEVEELFELKRGAYLKGGKIPSIDSRRYNFQISAKEGYLIEKGELEGPFRNASLVGITPEFLKSIDGVGKDFEMYPIPNCGKGDPMQTLHVGNGGPHLRGVALVTGAR